MMRISIRLLYHFLLRNLLELYLMYHLCDLQHKQIDHHYQVSNQAQRL